MKKGKFIMFDGIDGCGKDTLVEILSQQFKTNKIFNLNEYWHKHKKHPEQNEWQNFDIIISSEPTYATIGSYIRNELIHKDNKYSTQNIAQAYALDRNILYEKIILPALKMGKTIIQSRGVSTTIVYQTLTGTEDNFSLKDVLKLPGNQLALKHAPDFLVIPYITDIKKTISKRLANRSKKDDSIFEKITFLEKVQKRFRSEEYSNIFTKHNSQVIYIQNDSDLTDATKKIQNFYKKYLI